MSPSATVIASWADGERAYLSVRVEGDAVVSGKPVAVEYVASVPLAELVDAAGADLKPADRKAKLVAAVRAARDEQRAPVSDLGITGTIAL